MDTAEVRQKYDAFAPSYDEAVAALDVLGLRRLRRALLQPARGNVLEVGFGTGKSLPCYPPGCEITGVELSWEMLRQARRKMAQFQPVRAAPRWIRTILPFPTTLSTQW